MDMMLFVTEKFFVRRDTQLKCVEKKEILMLYVLIPPSKAEELK